MADETREDETADEKKMAEGTGETPAEAHREGEFEDLLRRIESMQSSIADCIDSVNGLKQQMNSYAATAVDNGAEVRSSSDVAVDADELVGDDEIQIIPDFKDFDLSM